MELIRKRGKAQPRHCFVNIYELDQAYGGPEEGGWYYEVRKPYACIRVEATCFDDTPWIAEKIRDALEAQGFVDKRQRYLVCPDGDDYQVVIEQRKPRYSPEVRPHYE